MKNHSCSHQWFEMKKISGKSSAVKKAEQESLAQFKKLQKENPNSVIPFDTFYYDDMFGVLIKCANCGLQKELMEDI